MSQNKDLRVRRTLANIRDAFLALVIEQGFENVTIQEIADRAMINRVTFYRHYTDKYDLAEKLSRTMFDREVDLSADPMTQMVNLFKHVAKYATFYQAATGPRGIPEFGAHIQDEIEAGFREQLVMMGLDEAEAQVPWPVVGRYAAMAQIGFLRWWLENGMPFSAETAARHLVTLHQNGAMSAAQGSVPTFGGQDDYGK